MAALRQALLLLAVVVPASMGAISDDGPDCNDRGTAWSLNGNDGNGGTPQFCYGLAC